MFFGSIPALVTPFAAGRVNEAAFRDLVDWQIQEGSNALVPCGTTGEAATLSTEEHHRLIQLTVEVARGRVPVIAGCGSNNTAHAIELTKAAREAGAAWRGWPRVGPFGDAAVLVDLLRAPGPETTALVHDLATYLAEHIPTGSSASPLER